MDKRSKASLKCLFGDDLQIFELAMLMPALSEEEEEEEEENSGDDNGDDDVDEFEMF